MGHRMRKVFRDFLSDFMTVPQRFARLIEETRTLNSICLELCGGKPVGVMDVNDKAKVLGGKTFLKTPFLAEEMCFHHLSSALADVQPAS